MLRLRDVTVCAADCVHPELAARALRISMERVHFGDAVLFSDAQISGLFRCEAITPLRSLDDYCRFCLHELAHRITTKFALVVQWDGYVLDPRAWRREFLLYDYIGAPHFVPLGQKREWRVGNGGFSLRSQRLLQATTTLPAVTGIAEDVAISATFRDLLVSEHGIRFPSTELAGLFAFQTQRPPSATFGFHGVPNLPLVEADDDAIAAVLARIPPIEHLKDERIFWLIRRALQQGRIELARRIYVAIRGTRTAAVMRQLLTRVSERPELAAGLIDQLEALPSG
jgi:hypothetical protein